MLLLGVVTKASSHPVGSRSFAWKPPESRDEVVPGDILHYYHLTQNTPKHRCNGVSRLPDGTMAKAIALLSSIADASAEVTDNP